MGMYVTKTLHYILRHYNTAAGFSVDAMFNLTNVKLDYITEQNTLNL